tara:strand:- start:2369 stop:3880 length:1512 start_codon:yes stop_codon:yes gene_type:complete
MKQLSGHDSVYLYAETPSTPGHLGLLYIYDQSTAETGTVRFKSILQHIEEHLDISHVFRSRLMRMPLDVDHPYWVDDENFDLEYHVRHLALPKPGDWRQFCILAARLHSRPLDMSRPLWEMYVIEGLDNIPSMPKGSFAIYTKIHHCAVDGAAAIDLAGLFHDKSPEPDREVVERQWKPEPKPKLGTLLVNTLVNNTRHNFETSFDLINMLPAFGKKLLAKALRQDMEPKETVVRPETRFNRDHVSPHRVFGGVDFSLEDIRSIKRAVNGATVNDVLLALCGGALHHYLQDKDELPYHSLRAIVPVRQNKRDRKGKQTMAVMTPPLHTQVVDPLERLEAIQWDTSTSAALEEAQGAKDMTDITRHMPSFTLALGIGMATHSHLSRKTLAGIGNCVMTNVPGPQWPLYMRGAKLVYVSALAPLLEGLTLMFNAVSYDGRISVSFQSDRDILPDPQFMEDCWQWSLDELRCAATQQCDEADAQVIHKVRIPKTAKRKPNSSKSGS